MAGRKSGGICGSDQPKVPPTFCVDGTVWLEFNAVDEKWKTAKTWVGSSKNANEQAKEK